MAEAEVALGGLAADAEQAEIVVLTTEGHESEAVLLVVAHGLHPKLVAVERDRLSLLWARPASGA